MSTYAVIGTGGKQYRVQAGDIVQMEKLEGDVGANLKFDQVLMVAKPGAESTQVWLGKPLLSGASVQGEVVGQGRGDKIFIVKMKRRKQYRRTQGHRQFYTQVLVTGIDSGAGEKATLDETAKKEKLARFQSHLKPKGPAQSISRTEMRHASMSKPAMHVRRDAAPAATAAKKAPAKKPAAKKSASPKA